MSQPLPFTICNDLPTNTPASIFVENLMNNTQPESIMKYKYVYGTHGDEWIKMFVVPEGYRSFLFEHLYLNTDNKVKVGNKSYKKYDLFLPSMLFILRKNENSHILNMAVHGMKGKFDRNNLQLFALPLPNLYDSGEVCQTSKIPIIQTMKNTYVYKNVFDICEFFIDVFMQSAFNSDLDGRWGSSVKRLGFIDTNDFIKTASDKSKMSYMKKVYEKSICKNIDIFNSIPYVYNSSEIFHSDILMNHRYIGKIFFHNSPNNIESSFNIGEYVSFKGDQYQIISYGPGVDNRYAYENNIDKDYDENLYISVIDSDENNLKIYFSEFEDLEIYEFEDIYNSATSNNNKIYRHSSIIFSKITSIKKQLYNDRYAIELLESDMVNKRIDMVSSLDSVLDVDDSFVKDWCDYYEIDFDNVYFIKKMYTVNRCYIDVFCVYDEIKFTMEMFKRRFLASTSVGIIMNMATDLENDEIFPKTFNKDQLPIPVDFYEYLKTLNCNFLNHVLVPGPFKYGSCINEEDKSFTSEEHSIYMSSQDVTHEERCEQLKKEWETSGIISGKFLLCESNDTISSIEHDIEFKIGDRVKNEKNDTVYNIQEIFYDNTHKQFTIDILVQDEDGQTIYITLYELLTNDYSFLK